MKKVKKNKLLGTTVLLATALLLLAGCSTKGECEECRQYEKLIKYESPDNGTYHLCDDCYKMAKLFGL